MSPDIEDESGALVSGTLSWKVQTEDQHKQGIGFVQDILFQTKTDKFFGTWCCFLVEHKCDQPCSFEEGQLESICDKLNSSDW